MKFTNLEQAHKFLAAVDSCHGDVWLESIYGDKFNLKSAMSSYIAMGRLLADKGEDLELFCSDKNDEGILLKYFNENSEVL